MATTYAVARIRNIGWGSGLNDQYMLNLSGCEESHPRRGVQDQDHGMRRSYDCEVHLRVLADCIEDTRHIHSRVYRFDEPHSHDDERENCDV